ncbi:MAG: BtpA/SgcQ family protein [Planctomycetes bacterium]|nr:BtpA/SgcQ family protein [Planctomycetota bacterium]
MSARPFLLLGVVHLAPLPGSPRFAGSFDAVIERARRDARALLEGGLHGVVVENFGDAPFYPDAVPPLTVAALTVAARELTALARDAEGGARFVGVNVLRNDAAAALAIAACVRADFVRINVHQGAVVADQGLLVGRAHETARFRAAIAPELRLYCDVRVKHAAPLAERALESEVEDLVLRGLADAVLVTGTGTGKSIEMERLAAARRAAHGAPVLIASGARAETLAEQATHADGAIVGSSLEQDGEPGAPVDPRRVARMMEALRALGRPAPRECGWRCA